MSGRSGFRKTSRVVEHRRLPHEMPDWHLGFRLPSDVSAKGCKHHFAGLTVRLGGWIEVRGKRRDWVISQAVKFVEHLEPRWTGTIRASMRRGGDSRIVVLQLDGESRTVVDGRAMRQVELAF